MLPPKQIDGQSTFVMSGSEGESDKMIALHIKEAASEVRRLRKEKITENISLLHMNCEGCEWELLESIIENDEHLNISVIQFGSHYFPEVKDIAARYCKVREQLSKTHRMVYGQSWAWERWDRGNL